MSNDINSKTNKDETNMYDSINKCDTIISHYTDNGKNLTPLNNKIPITNGWTKRKIPIDELRKHNGNFGVVLDERDLIVDVDPRGFEKDANGVNSLEKLQNDLGITLKKTVKTPRGVHCYFRLPKGVYGAELAADVKKYPGIDFRRIGHQCVIAGSRVKYKAEGDTPAWVGEYKWHEDNEDKTFVQDDAPQALIDLLTEDRGVSSEVGSVSVDGDLFYNLDAKEGEDPKGIAVEMPSDFEKPTLDEVKSYLYLLSDESEYEYNRWCQMGMIIHTVDSGKDGLAAFEAWSESGREYEDGECRKKWKSFNEDRDKKVNVGTLVNRVKDAIEKGRTKISTASSEQILNEILPHIRDSALPNHLREQLAPAVKRRLAEVEYNMSVGEVRGLLEKPTGVLTQDAVSEVCKWGYLNGHEKYVNLETAKLFTKQGFHNEVKHLMPVGKNGRIVRADKFMDDNKDLLPNIDGLSYLPMYSKGLHTIDKRKVLNTYDHSSVPRADVEYTAATLEDIETLKTHYKHICKTDEGAEILELWTAWQVQYPGKILKWAPLIQGVEGSGKTFMSELLEALLGEANVGLVTPSSVGDRFSGYATGVCVNVIEEISIKGHNRYDVVNKLKPLMTNKKVEVREMYVPPYKTINTTNYILFTNDKTAMPLDDTSRRYWIVFSQFRSLAEFEDHINCGHGEYFTRLFDILQRPGGLRKHFEELPIPQWFKRSSVAPHSDDKAIMIEMENSNIEGLDDVRTLIEKGGEFYCEEAVSSGDLFRDLRRQRNINISNQHCNKILTRLEYEQMPKPIKIDGKTRRIWTKRTMSSKEAREIIIANKDKQSDFEKQDTKL